MQDTTILVKPASCRCNLQCGYCFYRTEAQERKVPDRGIMSAETAEILIRRALEEGKCRIHFIFQGGEPMLAGLPFYRRFVKQVRAYNVNRLEVQFALQTNGVLLNEEWAGFLAEEKFLVGVSLDAPSFLHDRQRGVGTHRQVLEGIRCLREYGVSFNVLSVLTREAVHHPQKVWQELSPYGYMQFTPYIGEEECYIPSPEELGIFLCRIFDYYSEAYWAGTPVHVRELDGYLQTLITGMPCGCTNSGSCGGYFTVEADGSVYPCDFYASDEWYMGNIHTSSLGDLADSEVSHRFIRTSLQHPQKCRNCRWYRLCRAGCRRYRETSIGEPQYCAAYKLLLEHAAPMFLKMAQSIREKI